MISAVGFWMSFKTRSRRAPVHQVSDPAPTRTTLVPVRSQERVISMSSFSMRAWLRLTLCLMGVPACHAEAPQAQVNPVPLKLPVDHATDIRFAHISTAQGLSQIRVNSIVQDDQGFMWFGTIYGLNRFDGYTFKVYAHERDNPNSLSGVDVDSLFKDRDGVLWVGCEQALDSFDPKTEIFTHFPVPKVKQISQDRAGLLWLSTDRGLYQLDPKSGKIRVYAHDPSDPQSLPDNHVVATAEDKTGRFWVGEPYGMYEFDRATGHVKLSVPLHTASRDLSFHEDKEGDFWIIYGTGNGLAKFDRKRNVLTYFSFHAGDLSSTAYTGVDAMLEDRHGNLWLAKQGLGLLKFDREHNRFISYTHVPDDATSLAQDGIIAMFEDRDGSVWLGLPESGLQRFSPVPAVFQPLNPKEDGVNCFYEDSHRNLWIGSDTALYRVDPSGKRTAFVGVKSGVPFEVLSVVEDRAGFIWAGTSNNGLFRLDPKSGRWEIYRHNEDDPGSLSNNVVDRLLIDHDGTLWAATWDGLDRFDAHTDRFTTFKANPHAREQIYLSLAEDTQHDLWLGTFGFGLQHFNPKTAQFTTFLSGDAPGSLSDSEANWVHISHTGKLWVGTSNGLNEFDPETRHFTVYDAHDGMASTLIDCVLEDTRGKLWMSTTKGISSFDPSTGTFRNFSTAEGLPGAEMTQTGGCLRSASGRMYFAGLSGATTFLPEAIPEDNYAPPTVITDLRLLGSSDTRRPQMAPQAISYASEVTLSHKQTWFSLTFAALAYSDSAANRYRFRLENRDSSWTEVGSDGRTVNYSALPAGKYRFHVQGATISSQWSEPGAELEIVIPPPWWSTWWFRTLGFVLVCLLLWMVYRIRIGHIAKELRAQEALRALKERLEQATQVARAAAMSASIAHEINQPLCAIVTNAHTASTWLDATPANISRAKISIERVLRDGRVASEVAHKIRSLFARRAPEKRPVDVHRTVREIFTLLEPEIRKRDVEIVSNIPEGIDSFSGDEVQIQQILINLLTNALDAVQDTPPGERRIWVEAKAEGDVVAIRVRDTGPGVPNVDRIFETFFTTKAKGMGIGLAVSRSIAEAHGGSLSAINQPGSGAEFILRIPSVHTPEAKVDHAPESQHGAITGMSEAGIWKQENGTADQEFV
jgi:ligand-binding sensor domain-containing protein/signal transduction histidine kinase